MSESLSVPFVPSLSLLEIMDRFDDYEKIDDSELGELNKALRGIQVSLVIQMTTVKKLNKMMHAMSEKAGGETWKQWKADKESMRVWLNELTSQGGRFEAFSP